MVKVCSKCKIEKSLDQFRLNGEKKDGHYSSCKECDKIYRVLNKDKIKKGNQVYRLKNLDKFREKDRIKYQKNKESIRKAKKEYRIKNSEKIKQQKQQQYFRYKDRIKRYRQNNIQKLKDQRNLYFKKRKEKDPAFKLACNLRTRQYKVLKGEVKTGSAIQDLGCSTEFLKQYIESLWLPGMSWDNYGVGEGKWNVDHKIALLSPNINLSKREDYLKVSHYTNLQPMWQIDNIRKSNKYDI